MTALAIALWVLVALFWIIGTVSLQQWELRRELDRIFGPRKPQPQRPLRQYLPPIQAEVRPRPHLPVIQKTPKWWQISDGTSGGWKYSLGPCPACGKEGPVGTHCTNPNCKGDVDG